MLSFLQSATWHSEISRNQVGPISTRIDTTQSKFYELGKNIFNFKIQLSTRILIFNALVRSRLTFSCQTWSITNAQMNAGYMTMIRKMVKGGYQRVPGTYHTELATHLQYRGHPSVRCSTTDKFLCSYYSIGKWTCVKATSFRCKRGKTTWTANDTIQDGNWTPKDDR